MSESKQTNVNKDDPYLTQTYRNDATGLKYCSRLVFQRLQKLKRVNFNTFSQMMVEEILVSSGSLFHRDGPKNIRRRIYDSINVLIALNIVQKTKDKQLIWNGVNPLISTDEPNVQKQIEKEKTELWQLNQAIAKEMHHKRLMQYHVQQHRMHRKEVLSHQLVEQRNANQVQYFPMNMLLTPSTAMLECEVSRDGKEVSFRSTGPLTVKNDYEVLSSLYPSISESESHRVQILLSSPSIKEPEQTKQSFFMQQHAPSSLTASKHIVHMIPSQSISSQLFFKDQEGSESKDEKEDAASKTFA